MRWPYRPQTEVHGEKAWGEEEEQKVYQRVMTIPGLSDYYVDATAEESEHRAG